MDRHTKFFRALGAGYRVCGLYGFGAHALCGQEPNPTAQMAPTQDQQKIEKQDNGIYLYRVKVVQRDLDAVNYLHRNGSTMIGFKGTTLLAAGEGRSQGDQRARRHPH